MSPFSIDLGSLPQGSSPAVVEADPTALGLSDEGWTGTVRGDFRVERNGDRISVRGELRAWMWLECVRCLKGFEMTLRVPFELFAERAGSGRRIDEEILERDDYMKFHDGRELDLSEEAREVLLVELPMAPRCREDCRGLCRRCGADLNDGPCACEATDLDRVVDRRSRP